VVFDSGNIKKDHFSSLTPRLHRSPPKITTSAIAGTGYRGHYLMMTSSCNNAKSTTNGISVLLPKSSTMQATQTAKLPILSLPYAARKAHLFPALSSSTLKSSERLCNHGCKAIFNTSTVNVIKNKKTIMRGHGNSTNRMWLIRLPADSNDTSTSSSLTTSALPQAIACNAIKHITKANLVTFLHAAPASVLPH
jgi:hypothetical protein